MANVSYCPKCGAAVKPEFEFCTSCGFALSAARDGSTGTNIPEQPVPVTPAAPATPVPAATPVTPIPTVQPTTVSPVLAASRPAGAPLFSRQVHIIIIAVILAGLGVWIWSMEKDNGKHAGGIDSLVTGQDKDNTGQDDTNPPIVEKTVRLKAEDFAGTWRAYETNNPEETGDELGKPENDLFIEVSNGHFSMYPRSEQGKEHSAEFTCGEVSGNLITCSGYSKDDEENFTLKLEMGESKDILTLTISPEKPTEIMILKMRRLE